MSQLSDARAALSAAQAAEAEARATHRSLSADLTLAQQQAAEARAAGDIAILADASARVAALREVMADAAEVLRAKSAEARRAELGVSDIEASAAALRGQIDDLSAKLDSPRNDWQKAIWRAESAVQTAQHGLERAQRELQEANAHLNELRGRLEAIAG